jgi:hypothetical protein
MLRALRAVDSGFQGNKPEKGEKIAKNPKKWPKNPKIDSKTNISRGLQVGH